LWTTDALNRWLDENGLKRYEPLFSTKNKNYEESDELKLFELHEEKKNTIILSKVNRDRFIELIVTPINSCIKTIWNYDPFLR